MRIARKIWTPLMSAQDGRDYDEFVDRAEGGHYAQTRAWADVAMAGRPCRVCYFLARDDAGTVVASALVQRPLVVQLPSPLGIVDRGPVCTCVMDLSEAARGLASTARRHGVARLTVMPYWSGDNAARAEEALSDARFRQAQNLTGAHAVTMRLALAGQSDDQILAGKDKLRYELRRALKSGARTRRGEAADVGVLERLEAQLNASQGRGPRPAAWFRALAHLLGNTHDDRAALFLCECDGEPVSAVLVLRHQRLAVFVAGASVPSHRSYSKMALPLFEAVRWARTVGCATFDLGGVPMDQDLDPKRLAVARFKYLFAKDRISLVRQHTRWF
jgi:lipid II:glycine glycyltransferase (peptidoglycan interpeptide bridge formation enzyme)